MAEDGKSQDQFGFAVAAEGHVVLVGAPSVDLEGPAKDAGAAYVFRHAKQQGDEPVRLIAPDAKAGDGFGGNVKLWGNTALVGAIGSDREQGEDFGAVYAFTQRGDNWAFQQKLSVTPGSPGDAFGWGMAIAENLAVIGAPRDDQQGKDAGAAYVFERTEGVWKQKAKLMASDSTPGDLFGLSVAISGDTVLIGADLHPANGEKSGTAYVFVRRDGNWQQQAKLLADDGQPVDIFGVRLALEGDTAVISARRDDDPKLGVDAGAVYVFQREGAQWRQQQKLQAPDGKADDRFGRHVAINNGQILIGAMHQDATADNAGAAYVFEQAGDRWVMTRKLTREGLNANARMGWSVAMSDSHYLLGATGASGQLPGTGAVLAFEIDQNNAAPVTAKTQPHQ